MKTLFNNEIVTINNILLNDIFSDAPIVVLSASYARGVLWMVNVALKKKRCVRNIKLK